MTAGTGVSDTTAPTRCSAEPTSLWLIATRGLGTARFEHHRLESVELGDAAHVPLEADEPSIAALADTPCLGVDETGRLQRVSERRLVVHEPVREDPEQVVEVEARQIGFHIDHERCGRPLQRTAPHV